MSYLSRRFIGCTAVLFSVSVLIFANAAFAEDKPAEQPIPSSNPLSGNSEAIAEGQKLYVRWCQQCHGVKADGYSPRWGKHGADLRKFWRGFGEFVGIVLNGQPEKQMPPHKDYLNPEQIAQIGAYLESLALEGANWQ